MADAAGAAALDRILDPVGRCLTPDVARVIGAALRHVSVPAPVKAGDVLVPDAAGLGIDLVALTDVPAS